MAQKPPQGSDAQGVADEAIKVQVQIDLDDFYNRLENETRTALADLQQQGLTGQALADAVVARLQNLSDTPIEQMGRTATSESFNLGRNVAAQAGGVEQAVRTEILDEATCDPCASLDGKVVALNSDEYFRYMPPNLCDGRDNCRGFYIYRKGASE